MAESRHDVEPATITESPATTQPAPAEHAVVSAPPPELPPRKLARSRRSTWILAAVIAAAVLFVIFGVPWVIRTINTVSTDDAYVNGHVTLVAPRVPGQVVKVLVDDNYRVRTGDLLIQLDKQPYQVIVDQKQAALSVAQSNLIVADAEVRAMIGQGRAARFKLEHTIEDVNNQIAVLRANVAAMRTFRAKLALAQSDYKRATELQKTPGAISAQEVDLREESLRTAEAQLQQALEQVYQIRASLGLPMEPDKGKDLADVPADLDQNFSSVREALFQLLQTVAPLGIVPSSYNMTPKQVIAEFYARDPSGNLDKIYQKVIKNAPALKLAQSQLMVAQSDLEQANLNLSYCDVLAEIDGVITRRQVNPGNNVVAGQSVMALRSLTEIWVDANFKETQISQIRIGQPVDLDVDMYGSHKTFKGRVSGFTMGTGSTLAILPAENATGNFVKVVQRLPVRIDLIDYDPDKLPLFIGLSVTPYVYINEQPTGPNAGKVIQPVTRLPMLPLEQKLLPPQPVKLR
jgi:membrane fusion protein (multidrug efflux system)